MAVTHKRCNHPEHEGSRYLPVKEFHKQGYRNGRQYYRGTCRTCYNRDSREKGRDSKNNWAKKYKAGYVRARSRALTRLSHLVPELYERLLTEELQKEGVPTDGKIRQHRLRRDVV